MPIQQRSLIKTWFETGDYPTQQQFWDAWDSYWHKMEGIPISAITGLSTVLNSLQPNLPIVGDVEGDGSVVLPPGKMVLCIVVHNADAEGDIDIETDDDNWATVTVPDTLDEQTELLLRRTAAAPASTTLYFESEINFSYAIYTL